MSENLEAPQLNDVPWEALTSDEMEEALGPTAHIELKAPVEVGGIPSEYDDCQPELPEVELSDPNDDGEHNTNEYFEWLYRNERDHDYGDTP